MYKVNMQSFVNFDLLSVGVTIAAIGILGFVIFFSRPKSITSKAFLFFSIMTIIYSVFNYINYQVVNPQIILWLQRLVIFSAVWHPYSFYQLFTVFPQDTIIFSRQHKFIIIPLAIITSLITLTPFVFKEIIGTTTAGEVAKTIKGPGIVLFVVTIIVLIVVGIYTLIQKTKHAQGIEKHQFRSILAGTFLTFSLIILFNFIFPVFLNNVRFIPLGALFMFPFAAFTFYAIAKHHLLNIKVLSTEILTFVLAIVAMLEVIFSKNTFELIFRSGVFILILSFGILLIKSVLREVKLREELQNANEKLQVADRMKSQFLSFASHQVKSPMTVVKDYAELIADGSYGAVPDKVKETATKIHDSADRLIALVNNLLDLRRLEEGKVEYLFADMDINALVKNIFEDMKTLADAKGLQMTLDAPAQPIIIKADTEKIRQVIQNLIDNSVKYTEHGFIRVKIQTSNDKCQIKIEDSGIGIPQDLIPMLFEQFNRGSVEAKKIQGTGLGLYIAKKFMEAHHGTIRAESSGPSQGSTFIVELPYDGTK